MIAVPDSGNPAALGLARAAGLPQDDGFVKNRYVAPDLHPARARSCASTACD